MRGAVLLALVAWLLVQVSPSRELSGPDSEPLSNIELLIPLLGREEIASHQRRPDDDSAFSDIPADAFTLDEEFLVARDTRAGRHRPRSLYLQPPRGGERSPALRLRRACQRLARAGGEALGYLCRELLDLVALAPSPSPSRSPSPSPLLPAPHVCPCCGAPLALPWFRRDFVPIGEDAYL